MDFLLRLTLREDLSLILVSQLALELQGKTKTKYQTPYTSRLIDYNWDRWKIAQFYQTIPLQTAAGFRYSFRSSRHDLVFFFWSHESKNEG